MGKVIYSFGRFFGQAIGHVKAHCPAPGKDRPWCDQATADQMRGARSKTRSEPKLVFDRNGIERRLGPLMAKGGEGKVYPLADHQDVLVKIYHVRARNGDRLQTKLEAMRQMGPMLNSPLFGWPRLLVFDEAGTWRGYAMRRLAGVQMQTLCQPQLIAERLPHWSRREILKCARSFVSLVGKAHRNQVIIGDINPGNLLVDPQTCEVRGIDCDSYQIAGTTGLHPCPVGVPMLMAPELLGRDYSRVRRTFEQELFSVAIMLFRMFMLGLHPYSRTYGEDPVANLKSGHCAFGLGAGCRLPRGPWYKIWSHLPFRLKDLFIRTFRDGHGDPAARTLLEEWNDALDEYLERLNKGWFDPHLVPSAPKSSHYRGSDSGRRKGTASQGSRLFRKNA